MRVLKIVKNSSNIMRYLQSFFKVSGSIQRLVFFTITFAVFCHIITCLWVLSAKFYIDEENSTDGIEQTTTWMHGSSSGGDPFYKMSTSMQYLVSLYYTITTITTVGYGDISGVTPLEKVLCIIIMIVGVIVFSFASGALASIFASYDKNNAKLDE